MFYIKQELPINGQIKAKEVQLISDNGEKLGMLPIARALEIAEEKKLDLVLVSPNAQVPVCKIMNYGKYKFEQAKKEKEPHGSFPGKYSAAARNEQHLAARRVSLGGKLVGGEDLGNRRAVGLGEIPEPFLRAHGAQSGVQGHCPCPAYHILAILESLSTCF